MEAQLGFREIMVEGLRCLRSIGISGNYGSVGARGHRIRIWEWCFLCLGFMSLGLDLELELCVFSFLAM